jgi:hypothetical protein
MFERFEERRKCAASFGKVRDSDNAHAGRIAPKASVMQFDRVHRQQATTANQKSVDLFSSDGHLL